MVSARPPGRGAAPRPGSTGVFTLSARTHLRPVQCPQRPEHQPIFASQSCPGCPGCGQDGDLTRLCSEELTQGGGRSPLGLPPKSLEDPSGRGEGGEDPSGQVGAGGGDWGLPSHRTTAAGS